MPFVDSDGVRLYYETVGSGTPLVFAHEFGGNLSIWEQQLRFFGRYFHCIAYNARGYPPSDVPTEPDAYRQDLAGDDLSRLLTALEIGRAHIVGLSMGSVTALDFALRYGDRARSITLCGCGYGSIAAEREAWRKGNEAMADGLISDFEQTLREYANGPTRLTLKEKDPRAWQAFLTGMLSALHPVGASLTLRGIQARRPSLYLLQEQLSGLCTPTLVMVGDDDQPAFEPSLFLRRSIPGAALWVFPQSGHAVNSEEPDRFNEALLRFLLAVDNAV